MITLSPYNMTGPMVDSSDLTLKYSLVFSGQISPLMMLMMSTKVVMTVSWAEWVSSLSQDMTCFGWCGQGSQCPS